MKFKDFTQLNIQLWNQYFTKISQFLSDGTIQTGDGYLLFPNIALFIETKDHFIMELFGGKREFDGLNMKITKESSVDKYLYQFLQNQEGSTIRFTRNNWVSNLWLARDLDLEYLEQRFGFHKRWLSGINFKGNGSFFKFGKDLDSCHFNNCLVVTSFGNIHRAKHVGFISTINKHYHVSEYVAEVISRLYDGSSMCPDLLGVRYCRNENDELCDIIGQFTNLFLIQGIHEPTIGEFIKLHPDIITKSFSCSGFLYEPYLKWIEGNPDHEEKAINPDILLRRADGYFDIMDLKTALTQKEKITKGKRRRRRFIDVVEDGIAQLANYEEYFGFEKNRKYAEEMYGIKISKPRCFLVVGNYENAPMIEVEEASRKLRENYDIIDYDTLKSLALSTIITDKIGNN